MRVLVTVYDGDEEIYVDSISVDPEKRTTKDRVCFVSPRFLSTPRVMITAWDASDTVDLPGPILANQRVTLEWGNVFTIS